MNLDYIYLKNLKLSNITLNILNSSSMPIFLGFIYKSFILRQKTQMSEVELLEILNEIIEDVRANNIDERFYRDDESKLKTAIEYLKIWSDSKTKAPWLYKIIPNNETFYDLPPHTQKAYDFIRTLEDRHFIGTESRMRTAFKLLEEMEVGTLEDKDAVLEAYDKQIKELQEKRNRIENEEDDTILNEVALKERFHDFQKLCFQIISDCRDVVYKFKDLHREVNNKISIYNGSRGELIDMYVSNRNVIEDSDQGKSAQAFINFLLNSNIKTKFTSYLHNLLENKTLLKEKEIGIDNIFARLTEECDKINNTKKQIIKSLAEFICSHSYEKNNYISNKILEIKKEILSAQNKGFNLNNFSFPIELPIVDVLMPFCYTLYTEKNTQFFNNVELISSSDIERTFDKTALSLNEDIVIDEIALKNKILNYLKDNNKRSTTLSELILNYPLTAGIAELTSYTFLFNNSTIFNCIKDDNIIDSYVYKHEKNNEEDILHGNRVYISLKDYVNLDDLLN